MRKIDFVFGIVLVVLAGFFFNANTQSFGSVATVEAYNSTTTSSTYANTAYRAFSGTGMVGSIVITDDPSAGYIKIWDATTTATSTYQGESPAGTYGRLVAQTAIDTLEQAITLDVAVKYGLVIETQAGFNGIASITYKKY